MFSISYLLRNVFQILIIDIIYIYHLLHKSREIIMYFETYFVLCANCWPTTPTFDPPSNRISSIVKCGKNSIGINAFLEGIWLCAVGFGEKCIEKYGLFVDSLFWKEALQFFSLPLCKFSMTNSFYWLYFAMVSKILMDHFKISFVLYQPCTKISETTYLPVFGRHNELKREKKIQFQMCVWVVVRLGITSKAKINI